MLRRTLTIRDLDTALTMQDLRKSVTSRDLKATLSMRELSVANHTLDTLSVDIGNLINGFMVNGGSVN